MNLLYNDVLHSPTNFILSLVPGRIRIVGPTIDPLKSRRWPFNQSTLNELMPATKVTKFSSFVAITCLGCSNFEPTVTKNIWFKIKSMMKVILWLRVRKSLVHVNFRKSTCKIFARKTHWTFHHSLSQLPWESQWIYHQKYLKHIFVRS